MADDELEQAIARVCEASGADREEVAERAVLEHDGWRFGERVRVVEDDEDEGVCSGDVGFVLLNEVGAAQYRNVRVSVSILPDGMDAASEVDPSNLESA